MILGGALPKSGVTPSDRMLSIILAESEHLDNHEVLATERKPEGQAQSAQQSWRRLSIARATTKCSRPNGSPKGNPEGLGEMMKRVLHAVQLAVPIGIITRPNIAQRSNFGTAFGLHKIWLRYKVLACSEVVSLPIAEGVASLHPRLLKLSPPATILYAINKPISSTGDNRYIVPKVFAIVFDFHKFCTTVAFGYLFSE